MRMIAKSNGGGIGDLEGLVVFVCHLDFSIRAEEVSWIRLVDFLGCF